MFYVNCSEKLVENRTPESCNVYWDKYTLGVVCYSYSHKTDRKEIVYHRQETSYIPELIVRKFLKIRSRADLQERHSREKIHDSYGLFDE